jgi:hypothetical protein
LAARALRLMAHQYEYDSFTHMPEEAGHDRKAAA